MGPVGELVAIFSVVFNIALFATVIGIALLVRYIYNKYE